MTRLLILGAIVLGLAGCAQEKPTAEQIKTARASNTLTRNIDKSHAVADEASTRVDDPALH